MGSVRGEATATRLRLLGAGRGTRAMRGVGMCGAAAVVAAVVVVVVCARAAARWWEGALAAAFFLRMSFVLRTYEKVRVEGGPFILPCASGRS